MGGVLLALAAALAWTAANVSIQAASRRFGSFGALVWAQLIAIPLVAAAAALVEGAPGALDAATAGAIGLAGAAACVAYGGLFGALGRGQLAVVAPLISTWSVVSVAIGVIFLDEPVGALRLAGVATVVLGNVTLARAVLRDEGGGPGATPPLALALAVLSAVGFGALVPAVDVAGAGIGRLWALPAVWGADLLIALPFLAGLRLEHRTGKRTERSVAGGERIARGRVSGRSDDRRRAWGTPQRGGRRGAVASRRARRGGHLFGALVKTRPRGRADWARAGRVAAYEGAGFVLLSLALGLAPIAVVSPLASLATGLSVLYGVVVLRERVSPLALLGAAAASAGVFLVSV